jgi:hypothetical protein
MDVRPVRPADAPLVLALALDDRSHIVRHSERPASSPIVRTLAHTFAPLPTSTRAWLARGPAGVGLVEAYPRRYVIGWDIGRLVIRGDRDEILAPLIGAVTSYVQGRGVPRLFARCRREEGEFLCKYGFVVLAREYVLTACVSHSSEDSRLPTDSRYRMPQDAWPLHQLESQTTPTLIRQLQGMTGSDWSHQGKDMSEIVVEREGRIVAWLGTTKERNGQWRLQMLVHPDYRDVGPKLLHHALTLGPARGGFSTRVRDYQTDTLAAFTGAGFTIMAEETLLVKHGQVELAREAKRRVRLSRVPSMPAVPTRFSTEVNRS